MMSENDTSKVSILVVDDAPADLNLLTLMLTKQGYTVLSAQSGSLALSVAQAEPPDLILLDLTMPEMDGYAVCEQLKDDERTRNVPVIVISARGELEEKVKAFSLGAVDYVTKPFRAKEVLVRIDAHLTLRRLQSQLQERNAQLERANDELASEIAERKQAEEVIQKQHAFLKIIVDSLQYPLCVINVADYTLQLTNQAATGRKPGTTTCHMLLHGNPKPCNSAECVCPLQVVKGTGESTMVVHHHRDADGNPIHAEVHAYPIFDSEGEVSQIVEYCVDVTERTWAESALRESEARYRAVVEDQTELICRFQSDGTLTFVNNAYCRYFGRDYETLVGHSFIPFILEGDQENVQKHLAALNRDTPIGTMKYRVMTPDGRIRWQHWTNRARFDEEGCLIEFQSVGHDITEQMRTEEGRRKALVEMVQATTLMHAALNSTVDGIVAMDTQARVLVHNHRFLEMWRLSREWEALDVDERLASLAEQVCDPGVLSCGVGEFNGSPETEHHELVELKDGRIFEMHSAPFWSSGKMLGRVCAFRDVTDRIQAEDARRQVEEIEIIAEERQRIAQETHDGLVQNLAGLRLQINRWHDLVDADPAQMHEELDWLREVLGDNIQEIRRTILALRPIALDEQGFLPALRKLTTDLGELYRLRVKLNVPELMEQLPPSLELTIFRVVQEALNNVGKHAQANTAWVEVTLTSGKEVVVTIRDDGLGIDPPSRERVVLNGRLGLKQMRERVEKAGGTVSVQSESGQGAEVQVVLPLP
jgi:PAS domain S-box-containing protein